MNTEQKRPQEWDTLFANALELARANYEKEQDRHKVITDKAKAVFAIVGLVTAFGITRVVDAIPPLARSGGIWSAIFYLAPAGLSLVASLIALLHTLQVLRPREFAAISQPREYVNELYKHDKDSMIRALEHIYQRTAEKYHEVNKDLALRVGKAVWWATVAVVAAFLFFAMYCAAAWGDARQSAAIGRTGAASRTSTPGLAQQRPSNASRPSQVDSRKRDQNGKKWQQTREGE